jgi:hypothetical protein
MENESEVKPVEATNEVSFDFSGEKKVLQLSKNQLKKLGLTYKKEPTEKEKERNERLRQMQKERHERFRKEKEEFEKKQLEDLAAKIAIKDKPKQKYTKKPPPAPEPSSESDEDFKEFLKFKKAKAKAGTKPVKEEPSGYAQSGYAGKDESDDDRIQKKKTKAKEIIETVQKIDKTINQIYKNPYLDLFNQKK